MNKTYYLDVMILVLAALTTYRLSVLITADTIMEPVREFWQRRFPVADYFYDEKYVEITSADFIQGEAKAWPFRREVSYIDGFWISVNEYKMGSLVECFYCVSMWVAFIVTVATYQSLGIEYDWQFALNFLGIAAGAEIISNVLGRG